MSNKEDKNFVEEVWFVYGFKLGPFFVGLLEYENKGECCNVTFDPIKAFFGVSKERKKANKNLIGFYHSHPGGDPYLSDTDVDTMDAWVKAVGRPLVCGVFSGSKQTCYIVFRLNKDFSKTGYRKVPSKIFKIRNRVILIGRGGVIYEHFGS